MLILSRRVAKVGTGKAHEAISYVNNRLVLHQKLLQPLLGTKWSATPTGKLLVDHMGSKPTRVILAAHSLKLGSASDVGSTMPSTATQSGLAMVHRAVRQHSKHVASKIRDMDGSFDTLTTYDFAEAYDERVTPRIFRNTINSLPIMQQQAALNLALLMHSLDNKGSEFAELANQYGVTVGGMWDNLNERVFAGPGINTLFGITGIVHLNGDVPAAVEKDIAQWWQEGNGKPTKEELKQKIICIGGAAELGKQAALGALPGSQNFIDSISKKSPIFSYLNVMAARIFLTDGMVEGAVQARDQNIELSLQKFFATHKVDIKATEISKLLSEGATMAKPEAQEVFEIAAEISQPLAMMNVELAEERV